MCVGPLSSLCLHCESNSTGVRRTSDRIASMDNALTGPTRPPLSCGKAKYLVVLLHGLGSSADEIIDLSMDWAPTLNKAEFLAPNLPWIIDGNPNPAGLSDSPDDKDYFAVLTGRLHDYLDAVIEKKHLKNEQVAIVGFAEGAALALAVGIGRGSPLGAVAAIGRGLSDFPEHKDQANTQTPTLLVSANIGLDHPGIDWRTASKWLQGLDIVVEELQAEGNYLGLDDAGVIKIADYLRGRLAKPDSDSCD